MTRIDGWEWGNEGVDLYDDHLTWYEKEGSVRFASGAACDQTLADFLQRGPWVDGVPVDVVNAVKRAIDTIAHEVSGARLTLTQAPPGTRITY